MRTLVRRVGTPVAVATVLSAVVGAGTAWSYYTGDVDPSGTGRATPVAELALDIATTGTVSAGLYPGGPGADVTITVTNPYTRPITVTAVFAAGAVTASPVAGRTCATHGVTVAAPNSGLPATIAARATASVTLARLAKMGTNAASGCQGATFAIPFQVAGRL